MNQLLGDKASATDSTFLRELFLQCLSGNVRMVLASTAEPASLEQLAILADKIMEAVASPSISSVETSQLSTKLSELCAEVARLRQLVDSRCQPSCTRSSSPALRWPQPVVCWYHKKFGEAARKCKSSCSKSKKHAGQPLAVTGVAGLSPSHLFYISDHSTNLNFLVDTGAEVSAIPPTRANRNNCQNGLTLQAINNTSIPTYGKRSLSLDLRLRCTFRWVFVIAEVKTPILGANFLHCYGLIVNVGNKKLMNSPTQLQVNLLSLHLAQHSYPGSPTMSLKAFSMNSRRSEEAGHA